MADLNLKELDRLEREATDGPWPEDCLTIRTIHRWLRRHGAQRADEDIALISANRNQLRPLLDLVDRLAKVLAYRGCARRGPGGHYNSVRCLDQGTQDHGSDEYGDKPLAKEKWCDGCTALEDYQRAKGE